jgi:hypothetical protein
MAQNIKDEEEDVVLGNRRVALKPHAARIRQWVDEGRGDDWIARELNTTPSSVQSFRSRNSIYRRNSEVFTNEWRNYLRRNPEDLQIIVTQDRIYLEKVH